MMDVLKRNRRIIYIGAVFFAVMLFFTLISYKVDGLMTPYVRTARAEAGIIAMDFRASGEYNDGAVVFNIPFEQDEYIGVGDTVEVGFANTNGRRNATVREKAFDSATQTMSVRAAFNRAPSGVYDGQRCEAAFYYIIGEYGSTLPRGCVFYENGYTYIYGVSEERTVLGERYIARRHMVSVLAEDEYRAAVDYVPVGVTFAYYTDKPLSDGMKVNVRP